MVISAASFSEILSFEEGGPPPDEEEEEKEGEGNAEGEGNESLEKPG